MQGGAQKRRAVRNWELGKTGGRKRLAQHVGLWVLYAQVVQGHTAVRHGVGRMGVAPLDQRGQAAVKQALAIGAHADLPLQQAI